MSENDNDAPCALVVDDDFLVRLAACDILADAGFQVVEADNGDQARIVLEERQGDVVLLFTDVQMPGLDGFALARLVDRTWPHVSIVVASGQARPGPGELPPKACFIAKPFSATVVHDHVREILPDGQKPASLRRGDVSR